MDNTLAMSAGCIAFNSWMSLLRFPGGLASIVKNKTDGVNWVFIHADLIALSISMTVLIVGMSVGPTFWKKIEERARKAVLIAMLAMAIAVHQVVLTVIGKDNFGRVFVNGLGISFMGVASVCIIILRSGYRTK